MDQLFSILASEFKDKEIRTVEDLFYYISEAPIQPKPSVEDLEYIWDWKTIVEPLMTGHLINHSYPHAFQVKKEEGLTKFRYKDLPQDHTWYPEAGLKLLKQGCHICPVPAADFRIETLNLDLIGADYMKYVNSIKKEQVRSNCLKSWERLRNRLEKMPRKKNNLPKMKMEEFLKQTRSVLDVYEFAEEEEEREVRGVEMYPEKLGVLKKGDNVVIYTSDYVGRPWIGRVISLSGDRKFVIHWFEKKSAKVKYEAQFRSDGTPCVDTLDRESIMFIGIASFSSESIIKLTPKLLDKILVEYDRLDATSSSSTKKRKPTPSFRFENVQDECHPYDL